MYWISEGQTRPQDPFFYLFEDLSMTVNLYRSHIYNVFFMMFLLSMFKKKFQEQVSVSLTMLLSIMQECFFSTFHEINRLDS